MRCLRIGCMKNIPIDFKCFKNILLHYHVLLVHLSFKISCYMDYLTKYMFRHVHEWGYPYS